VGKFLNEHFAAGFQKVGTFKIVNGQKTGGNVATYFCTADGRVLHAIAGPVDARTLLQEAKWVLDIHEKAKKAADGKDADYVKFVRQAHAERLEKDSKKREEDQKDEKAQKNNSTNDLEKALARRDIDNAKKELDKLAEKLRSNDVNEKEKEQVLSSIRALERTAKITGLMDRVTSRSPHAADVHRLLSVQALDDIDKVYTKVWEGILKEKVSNDPVRIR
jgi:hypothetical protein